MIRSTLWITLCVLGMLSVVDSFCPGYKAGFVIKPSFVPFTTSRTATRVFAKKKKKAAAAGGGKLQVKLLKHVAGTGQAGEVVMVTPAFFQNKLRPTRSATLISDEEVEKEAADRQAKDDAKMKAALDLQSEITDMALEITRKAGPDGQLFGGVSVKGIFEELNKKVGKNDVLKSKGVKMLSLKDEDGNEIGNHGIKHVGDFDAVVSLQKDVTCEFQVKIVAKS